MSDEIINSETIADFLWMKHHHKQFGKSEVESIIRQSGFEVKSIRRTHPFIDFYPGAFLNRFWNWLYRYGFRWIAPALYWTPFRLFFHHFRIIAVKK